MPATAYKNRRLPNEPALCTICGVRTRGKTTLMRFTHGVTFHLCADHASEDFQSRNSGRDFVLTLTRIWHGDGCLTQSRARALSAFLEREQARGRVQARARPGSYAWKALRNEVEHRGAAGEPVLSILADLRARHAHDIADAPSERTIRRWYGDRRWEDDDYRTPLRPGYARRDPARAARAQRERAPLVRLRATHTARKADRAAGQAAGAAPPGPRPSPLPAIRQPSGHGARSP